MVWLIDCMHHSWLRSTVCNLWWPLISHCRWCIILESEHRCIITSRKSIDSFLSTSNYVLCWTKHITQILVSNFLSLSVQHHLSISMLQAVLSGPKKVTSKGWSCWLVVAGLSIVLYYYLKPAPHLQESCDSYVHLYNKYRVCMTGLHK